jgi:phosphoenolpyruvate---glycerone phosphotransferase subunit DhaL
VILRDDLLAWVRAYALVVSNNRERLNMLDAEIGDGDHGSNMDRGMQAVLGKLPDLADKDFGTVLKAVGMTLVSTVGGASGPLYGTMFLKMGQAACGKLELGLAEWIEVLEAGVEGVIMRGKAAQGDKTMVDTLVPALRALQEAAGSGCSEALRASAAAAKKGMLATVPMVARKGRASYLGERSAGHQDPGATSARMMLQACADTWA